MGADTLTAGGNDLADKLAVEEMSLEVMKHGERSFDDRAVLHLIGPPPRYDHFLLGLLGVLPLSK